MKTWVILLTLLISISGYSETSYITSTFPAASEAIALVFECNEMLSPFDAFDLATDPQPFEVDIDNDGDMDIIVGGDGKLFYFEKNSNGTYNNRTGTASDFLPNISFLDMTVGLCDLDGDGDQDLSVVGNEAYNKFFFWNTGSATQPIFTYAGTAGTPPNPISLLQLEELDGGPNIGYADASIFWLDLDGDDDYDAVVGGKLGWFQYYENIGSRTIPNLKRRNGIENPFEGLRANGANEGNGWMQYESTPFLLDWDSDGDFDLFSGNQIAGIQYFENVGTATLPAFIERIGMENPLAAAVMEEDSHLMITDIDCDGDWDLVYAYGDTSEDSRISICDLPDVGSCGYSELTISGSVTDISCAWHDGADDGAIYIVVAGGKTPYTYDWTTADGWITIDQLGNANIHSLTAGTYTLIVTDANGDTERSSFTVGQPSQISILASTTDLSCHPVNGEEDGSIDVAVTGGVPPYTYQWSSPDGFPSFSTDEDILGLTAGTYSLIVTDADGCSQIDEYTLIEPESFEVIGEVSDLICNESDGPATGALDLSVLGFEEYTLDTNLNGGINNDITFDWSTTDGSNLDPYSLDQVRLGSGEYCITVTSENGCTAKNCFIVAEPALIKIEGTIIDVQCEDNYGEIVPTVTGGTEPYTYNWYTEAATWSTSVAREILDLSAGTYELTITDANGCTAAESFEVKTLNQLEVNVEGIQGDCSESSIDVQVSGGTGSYTISWVSMTGGFLNEQDQTASEGEVVSFTGTEVGETFIFIIEDTEGCTGGATYTTGSMYARELGVPYLCLVTADQVTGNVQILWEDPADLEHVKAFEIYREDSGQFELIGTVDESAENLFIDETADLTTQSFRYQVYSVDKCNKSDGSEIHKTIHLLINQGVNGSVNLSWDSYEGVDYAQLNIYRGASPETLELWKTLSASNFSFTDDVPLSGAVYYQIELVVDLDCDYMKNLLSIRSNIEGFGMASSSKGLTPFDVKIYPNPAENFIYMNSDQALQVSIMDNIGKLRQSAKAEKGRTKINLEDLPEGVYFIQLSDGSNYMTEALLIQN